ncbi:MAG: OsmC family protein [Deltaproteobacteria bacterium]|nr:OsmC family protein [Deltaproteobacteria bacterium]
MFSQLTRYASELDIQIDEAEMDIRMTYDTRGKLLLADVSPGCQEVTYVLNIQSPASAEKVRQMVDMIERGCHTMNTIKNPVPVSGRLVHNGQEFEVKV